MSAATSSFQLARVVMTTAVLATLAMPAMAQAVPDTENGRYTLAPMSGGFARLDTRTGVVSHCTDKGHGWACYALPDERAALDTEIGRLQTENEKLKTQLAAREPTPDKTQEALPKVDSLKPDGKIAAPKTDEPKTADANRNRIEIPLPSDHDMDRVMSFVERAWRRLIEMAARVQRDVSGKI